jgi:hypothetical protein
MCAKKMKNVNKRPDPILFPIRFMALFVSPFVSGVDVIAPGGRGARFNAQGIFEGFLDP